MEDKKLIEFAKQAVQMAYAPYSKFNVGAALLTKSGKVYCGCNIENSSFGATNCAERTAVFKAISDGERAFEKIAVVGGKDGDFSELCFPCGICRQVLSEFCDKDFQIVLCDGNNEIKVYSLEEMMPYSFSLD